MKKNRFFSLLLAAALALSLSVPAMALDDPQPNCSAAILVDGDHGEVLYEQNGYERIYPASITKIMTSLVVLEAIEAGELSLDDQITASQQAVTLPEGSSNANPPIQAGARLPAGIPSESAPWLSRSIHPRRSPRSVPGWFPPAFPEWRGGRPRCNRN